MDLEQETTLDAAIEQETTYKKSRIQDAVHSTIQPSNTSETNIHVEVKAFWHGVAYLCHPTQTTNVSVESIKDAL